MVQLRTDSGLLNQLQLHSFDTNGSPLTQMVPLYAFMEIQHIH